MKIASILSSMPVWVAEYYNENAAIREGINKMSLGQITRYQFFEGMARVFFYKFEKARFDIERASKFHPDIIELLKTPAGSPPPPNLHNPAI